MTYFAYELGVIESENNAFVCGDSKDLANLTEVLNKLIESLENMMACAEQHGWDESLSGAQILMADARAAIAKAKGESAE